MARELRIESPTGYYHIMTRGINKRKIFLDDKDYYKYLSCLEGSINKYNIKIVCYCLMPNHTHLVVEDSENIISRFMQSLNSKYAAYFNRKYNRIGPLYQGRFNSECIQDQRQLLAAYRYVLNNPWKAKMCMDCDYKWNSYSDFNRRSKIVDTSIILKILGDENAHRDFVSSYIDEHFMDID